MAFHIQHAYLHNFKKVFVLSNDADVLILLLNHLLSSWHQLKQFISLYETYHHGTRKTSIALYILLNEVDSLPVNS